MMHTTILLVLVLVASVAPITLASDDSLASHHRVVHRRTQDCHTPNIPGLGRPNRRMIHGQTEYLHGRSYDQGSIYRVCRDNRLVCYEDDGVAETTDPEVDCAKALALRRLGVAIDPTEVRLWPQSALCYAIDSSFNAIQVAVLHEGFDHIRAMGVVRILSLNECRAQPDSALLCGGCRDYAYVENAGESCSARVGYQGNGSQHLRMPPKCFNKGYGTFVHELFHAFGVYHEQVHPHAKSIVLADEIPHGHEKNYFPKPDSVYVDFDAMSIMHYHTAVCLPKPEFASVRFCNLAENQDDGCVEPSRTIHCDDVASQVLGNRKAMTDVDKATLTMMYGPKHDIYQLRESQRRRRDAFDADNTTRTQS
ncbi:Aste57867_1181 [Aphanomyces stellatus]|uniref:Aste57867_1181 protein n=1 Tax=Aphanomyces stellatus TaxID=120398 RepID=A0A485KA09_9STRA|nr:hypothetical protein As57867_001180 [Aphanomyces stellatus]VFT78401.1 Aste57867_1181 [Aphanomyces stellatus]